MCTHYIYIYIYMIFEKNDLTKSVLKLLAYVFAYVISWASYVFAYVILCLRGLLLFFAGAAASLVA